MCNDKNLMNMSNLSPNRQISSVRRVKNHVFANFSNKLLEKKFYKDEFYSLSIGYIYS